MRAYSYLKSRHNSRNKVTVGPTFTSTIKPWGCVWNSKASGNLNQESGVPPGSSSVPPSFFPGVFYIHTFPFPSLLIWCGGGKGSS